MQNSKISQEKNSRTHHGCLESNWIWKRKFWWELERQWWLQGSDSFSKHFAQHCRDCKNSNEVKVKLKDLMVPKILWQGSQIGCMKTACTLNCKLCMVERKAICSLWRSNKSKIINNKSEIFGSCKCETRFHKFTKVQPTSGTEEAFNAEKVNLMKKIQVLKIIQIAGMIILNIKSQPLRIPWSKFKILISVCMHQKIVLMIRACAFLLVQKCRQYNLTYSRDLDINFFEDGYFICFICVNPSWRGSKEPT